MRGSNRESIVREGEGEDDPLQTTVVRFKVPAAQKTFVLWHGCDENEAGYRRKKGVAYD